MKKLIFFLCLFFYSALSAASQEASSGHSEYTVRSKKSKKAKKASPQPYLRPLPPSIKVKCRNGVGMFSIFLDVLYALWEFDHRHLNALQIDFGQDGLYYDPAFRTNWWEYYFEPIRLGSSEGPFVEWEYGGNPHVAPWSQWSGIPRDPANKLIVKYIHPKPHIIEKIEQFRKEHFLGAYVIGVHYRGTDKSAEAPRVNYEEAQAVIWHMMHLWEQHHPEKPCRIFIATDEQAFIDYASSMWGNRVCYCKTIRSNNGKQIHYGENHSPYRLGEEAVIDMLLLSKSDLLIRTSSNLSLCSTFFNPTLPVIELSQQH